jgi:hypothetical protein
MRGTSGPNFEAAISTYRPDLLRWAIGRVGVDDAEDLVQDALLRAVAIQLRPRSSWRTWLFAIINYTYVERSALLPSPVALIEGMAATDLRGRVVVPPY